jgi:magnesium chelatase subunit D
MYKTAQTLAAWEEHSQVTVEDVRRSAEFVLLHRRRRQPFEEPGLDQQQLDDLIREHQSTNNRERNRESSPADSGPEDG